MGMDTIDMRCKAFDLAIKVQSKDERKAGDYDALMSRADKIFKGLARSTK